MTQFDDDLFEGGQAHITALGAALSKPALEGVARDVVQRLADRHGGLPETPDRDHPDAAVIQRLSDALISHDPDRARAMMRALQRDGLTLSVLYARYLAAAAARLGEMWDEDRISFTTVTTGVGRIYGIVRVLRDALPPPRITRRDPVLFASVPGEKHAVGLQMAAELFRQNGWDVITLAGASHEDIVSRIGAARFLIVGLSSSGAATAEALARLIHSVRVAYPEVYILVSGRIVTEDADMVALLAPDGVAATVEEALATMDALAAG